MQDPYCAQSYEASDTPETVLREGCTVKMEDLTSEAGKAVNGKEGVLGAFDSVSGRWVVTIDGIARKYRRENLGFVRSADGYDTCALIMQTPQNPYWKDCCCYGCSPCSRCWRRATGRR